MVHILNGMLAIKRNTFKSVLMRQMNLKPAIWNEGSQKERNTYCILMHMCVIQKDSMEESIYRAALEMQTQKIDLQTQWRKEREGQIERVTWKHKHYHVQNRQPVGTCCRMQAAQTQRSVTTWRGAMVWEVGGRFKRG